MTDDLGERVAICGEERTAFPAPGVVAELEGFAGLPERKLATLRALAQAAAQGALDGDRLRAMGGDAAVDELQGLPGVGPFTAQGIVVRGAGEPDYLATAEPRMAHAAALAYGLDEPLAAAELTRRGEVWRPYRSWVGLLLRLSLGGRVARDAPAVRDALARRAQPLAPALSARSISAAEPLPPSASRSISTETPVCSSPRACPVPVQRTPASQISTGAGSRRLRHQRLRSGQSTPTVTRSPSLSYPTGKVKVRPLRRPVTLNSAR